MKKKIVILAVSAALSVGLLGGVTYAVRQASTMTDKTISTSSIEVNLHMEGANVDSDGNIVYQPEEEKDYTFEETVYAENTGDKDIYLRVRINKAWYEGEIKVFEKNGKEIQANQIQISLIHSEDWIQSAVDDENSEDIYLYYTRPLAAGESTSALMDGFSLLQSYTQNSNHYAGLSVRIRFDADAVQAMSASSAMVAEWGVIPTFDSNGIITAITEQ